MSTPPRGASLEEGPILKLIGDYFEQAGYAECLLSLENSCKPYSSDVGLSSQLPHELSALRDMALTGRWDQVVEYLNAFSGSRDAEGLKQCFYAVHKQKYLEILEYVESDIRTKFRLGYTVPPNGRIVSSGEAERVGQLIEKQLATLEPLCPTSAEYKTLKDLLSLPSISSSSDFHGWNLHMGRVETYYRVGEWVSRTLYLYIKFPTTTTTTTTSRYPDNSSCVLLRLVAKGLLYEQCEKSCRARCGEQEQLASSDNLLDLESWIQQQPDSSFQLSPTEISLSVKPMQRQQLPTHYSLDGDERSRKKDQWWQQAQGVGRSISSLPPLHLPSVGAASGKRGVKEGGGVPAMDAVSAGMATSHQDGMKDPQPLVLQPYGKIEESGAELARPGPGGMSNDNDNTKQQHRSPPPPPQGCSLPPPSPPSPPLPPLTPSSHLPPPPPSSPITQQARREEEATMFTSFTPVVSMKYLRDSSTPRDGIASQASLKTSPPSSPILHPPTTHSSKHSLAVIATPTTSGHAHTNLTFRHIDTPASALVGEVAVPRVTNAVYGESLDWPSVSLLGTVSDKQVVRSVAFSMSGKVVAVGANSRTLCLCQTAQLLDKKNAGELEVLYQHPHYHKSSIYCMAWKGDSLLASGSNDQTIRLLTCTSNNKFKLHKPLTFPKGTVRDLLFTEDGLLVSGGSGSTCVDVTDITTYTTILSLAGHSDQVLALGSLPGGLVLSGGQDKTVRLWDTRTHLPITSFNFSSPVTSLSVCRGLLATAHSDASCCLHDLNTYRSIASYMPHASECKTVRFCPGSSRTSQILSGSYDGTVCLAKASNVTTEHVQWTKLCHHSNKVIQCRWHPSGQIFASTGADKKACFWKID